jgi:uncharacterized spore protein YtfJ
MSSRTRSVERRADRRIQLEQALPSTREASRIEWWRTTKEPVMDDLTKATRDADASVPGGMNDIVARLADRVGERAGVRTVFGDPVERDGTTVIPVGRMRWGFGGGGGRGGHANEEGEGSGGGGGGMASPVGYIEISNGTARFQRIGLPVAPATLIAVAVAFYVAMRGLRALLR